MAAGRKEVAQAEINNFDVAVFANENIFDFEVPMNDAISVTVIQGARNLATEFASLLLLKLAVGYNIVEHLAAVDVLEQHIPVIIRSNDIAHAADMRMVEQGNDSRLASCSYFFRLIRTFLVGTALVFLGRASGDDFASDLLGAIFLPSKLHLAHASSANGLAQDPFPGLCRNGSSRSRLLRRGLRVRLGLGLVRVGGGAPRRGVRRGAIAGGNSSWRHVGLRVSLLMMALAGGAVAIPTTWLRRSGMGRRRGWWRWEGLGGGDSAPCRRGGRTIPAGAALGV